MAEKRAHHNALERKRRDHIKDSFSSLRESVPLLQGEKVVSSQRQQNQVSRALILKKAADYIQHMKRKNLSHQQDIEDLKRQNQLLEQQIKTLEKAKATGNFAGDSDSSIKSKSDSLSSLPPESGSGTESSDSEESDSSQPAKKLRAG